MYNNYKKSVSLDQVILLIFALILLVVIIMFILKNPGVTIKNMLNQITEYVKI